MKTVIYFVIAMAALSAILILLGGCQSTAPKWSMYRLDKDYNWKRVR